MMNTRLKTLFLFALSISFAFNPLYAQHKKHQISNVPSKNVNVPGPSEKVSNEEVKVTVNFDHNDWLYKVNEEVKISIHVYENEKPAKNVNVHYTVGQELMPPTIEKDVLLKNGNLEIIARGLEVPGFLRCMAEVEIGGKKCKGMATAGFDVLNIQPTTDLPSDFMNFWDKGKADLAKIPMNFTKTLLPALSNDSVDTYQISFDNIKGKMYGMLCVPHKEGKYPAILQLPGAGVYPSSGDRANAARGAITLYVGIHGIPLNMDPSVYKDLSAGSLNGYMLYNMDDKEKYYYRRVILGCLRAVDCIFTLPQFDGKNIGVTGGSQGGLLSLATTALDSRIKYIACLCPAMSDMTGYLHGRAGGWPHLKFDYKDSSSKFETSKYYDAVNFARFVKVPGYYSWGYNDETTAPTTTYSVYNVIHAPKELHILKEIKHESHPDQQKQRFDFLFKRLDVNNMQSGNRIKDLVLIYDGGTHRLPWTKDRIKPYIYRENNGNFEWLFDGYLFLEIFDTKRNIAYDPGFKRDAATKDDFRSLLNTYFNKETSFGALESVLDSLEKKGHAAQRKRKVVISIPVPRKDFTEWGSVNGIKLDFKSTDDIFTAVQWYIDESLKMWKERNYKHLELEGFYWVSENDHFYGDAMRMTGKYLEKVGKPFYWIPHFNASGANVWKEYGFDYAYFQPNYFFSPTIPYSRLNESCGFAREHGLSMEMEFDSRMIADTTYRKRFDDYVKVFTEQNVWKYPVAYYEGGGAWGVMSKSNDPEIRKRYEQFGDIIARRQIEADKNKK